MLYPFMGHKKHKPQGVP